MKVIGAPKWMVGVAAAVVVLVGGHPSRAKLINRVVAVIDGDPITLREFDQYVERRGAAEQPAEVRRVLLKEMITEKLIEKEVTAQGINARGADVDRYIEQIKERNALTDEQFEAALEAQGLDLEAYREQVKAEIEKVQLVNREIRGRVNITPEEVERYYRAHLEEYALPERVRLRHIFLSVPPGATAEERAAIESQAASIREEAARGEDEDFAELAMRYSEGPGAGEGGDLGFIARGQAVEEIEAVAFRLEPGEVSDVITTGAGLHIVQLVEREEASARPLAEEAEEIKQRLYEEALSARFQRWLEEDLPRRHYVEVRL